mmetsp:Transcript_10277/g.34259  ORF Transcript_10277/g.34259 Transcript_10277/m.34259 type:complete len:216 (+) Transcript_10277:1341-1988(+)
MFTPDDVVDYLMVPFQSLCQDPVGNVEDADVVVLPPPYRTRQVCPKAREGEGVSSSVVGVKLVHHTVGYPAPHATRTDPSGPEPCSLHALIIHGGPLRLLPDVLALLLEVEVVLPLLLFPRHGGPQLDIGALREGDPRNAHVQRALVRYPIAPPLSRLPLLERKIVRLQRFLFPEPKLPVLVQLKSQSPLKLDTAVAPLIRPDERPGDMLPEAIL